jgi:hypothetical protein
VGASVPVGRLDTRFLPRGRAARGVRAGGQAPSEVRPALTGVERGDAARGAVQEAAAQMEDVALRRQDDHAPANTSHACASPRGSTRAPGRPPGGQPGQVAVDACLLHREVSPRTWTTPPTARKAGRSEAATSSLSPGRSGAG